MSEFICMDDQQDSLGKCQQNNAVPVSSEMFSASALRGPTHSHSPYVWVR